MKYICIKQYDSNKAYWKCDKDFLFIISVLRVMEIERNPSEDNDAKNILAYKMPWPNNDNNHFLITHRELRKHFKPL